MQVSNEVDAFDYLISRNLITDAVQVNLNRIFPNNSIGALQQIFSKGGKYTDEMKQFAVALSYYSTAAYNYLRETIKIALPSIRTLQRWTKCVDWEARSNRGSH